jgi:hypothetical protein
MSDHPHVPLSDWNCFRQNVPPFKFEKVINRGEVNLPKWYLPLARGVAVASKYFLHMVGYRTSYCPRSWQPTKEGDFRCLNGEDTGFHVRRVACGGQNLWTIERFDHRFPLGHEVLVHVFGSTPVVTRRCHKAMHIAEHCHWEGPPLAFRWVAVRALNQEAAIKFAQDRRRKEARLIRSQKPLAQTRIKSPRGRAAM